MRPELRTVEVKDCIKPQRSADHRSTLEFLANISKSRSISLIMFLFFNVKTYNFEHSLETDVKKTGFSFEKRKNNFDHPSVLGPKIFLLYLIVPKQCHNIASNEIFCKLHCC